MVIGSIVDCLILTIPPNFLDPVWLSTLIREWVLRGTIPLMGFALLLLGAWCDVSIGGMGGDRPNGKQKKSAKPRWFSGVASLALCYGVLFMLLIPLYFNSSRLASAATARQLNAQATQAEQELDDRLAERREQINLLLSDDARRQELQTQLRNAEDADTPSLRPFSPEQQTELQQLLDLAERVEGKPQVLDQELNQARQTGLQEIKAQQQQERDRLSLETRKVRLHTMLTSLALAVGYGTIACTNQSPSQKKQARSVRRFRKG